jgi:VHL beta domain
MKIVVTIVLLVMCLASSGAEAKRLDCNAVRSMKSKQSNTSITIKFINQTSESRTAMWVDFKGNPVQYFTLEPGKSFSQQTFLTHPWFFTDGPGNCIEAMIPSAGKTIYKIKVPSPGFGAE